MARISAPTIKVTIDGMDPVPADNITQDTERIRIDSIDARKPDPKWSHTDPAGHFHAYADDGRTPTLETVVVDTVYCDDCQDDHEITEIRCRECGAPVEPATIPDTAPHFIPGPESWRMSLMVPIDLRTPVAVGRVVSVRVELPDEERFAFATVTSLDMDGHCQLSLHGFHKRLPLT